MDEEVTDGYSEIDKSLVDAFNRGVKAGDEITRMVISKALEKSDSIESFTEWLKKYLKTGQL